jgi:hypothetical protein
MTRDEQDRLDAQRWRKFINVDRIRILGSARLGHPEGHMGFEVWGKHPFGEFWTEDQRKRNQEEVTRLVDAFEDPRVLVDEPSEQQEAFATVVEAVKAKRPVPHFLTSLAGLDASWFAAHGYLLHDVRRSYMPQSRAAVEPIRPAEGDERWQPDMERVTRVVDKATAETPLYTHTCTECTYLGRIDNPTQAHDLYYCDGAGPSTAPTVCVRWGSDPREMIQERGHETISLTRIRAGFTEARHRATLRGLSFEPREQREPQFTHDCTTCTFLGRYVDTTTDPEPTPVDLYHCTKGPTVIARYGSEGPQYTSGIGFRDTIAAIAIACDRAAARGLPLK